MTMTLPPGVGCGCGVCACAAKEAPSNKAGIARLSMCPPQARPCSVPVRKAQPRPPRCEKHGAAPPGLSESAAPPYGRRLSGGDYFLRDKRSIARRRRSRASSVDQVSAHREASWLASSRTRCATGARSPLLTVANAEPGRAPSSIARATARCSRRSAGDSSCKSPTDSASSGENRRPSSAQGFQHDRRQADAQLHLVEPDAEIGRRPDAHVGLQRQHAPAGDRVPVHRRHDRNGQLEDAQHRPREARHERAHRLLVERVQRRKVEPRGEEPLVAGDDQRPRARGERLVEQRLHSLEPRRADGVGLPGPHPQHHRLADPFELHARPLRRRAECVEPRSPGRLQLVRPSSDTTGHRPRRILRRPAPQGGTMTRRIALLLVAVSLAAAPRAQARITRIVYTTTPAFGGQSFGNVGTFDKLVGTAFGEVDPRDPRNAIIQDIELAPRNARGMVEYSADLYLIKPHDMTKGNRILFYNVHNRGNKGGLNTFNLGVQGSPTCGQNDPVGAGDGFLQNAGFTIIWSGWQPDVLPGNCRMTAKVPVARNRDGSSITGTVRSELKLGPGASAAVTVLSVSSGHFTGLTHAPYATVSTDNRKPLADGFVPTLTKRLHVNDPRVPVPNDQWFFASSCTGAGGVVASATQICLPAGFQPGVLYELIYRAKDPTVLALGWAGMRDLISFFKHARQDDAGTANPLFVEPQAGDRDEDDDDGEGDDEGGRRERAGTLAVFEGSSQSGRSMRTFLHLGFNEDERGRIVFEGAYPHIGGGRLPMNTRFSAPGRAWGYTVDHLYPAYEFPFTYQTVHDPLTHQTDGILRRCRRTHTCPKIFHVATALEIWEGRQSLGFTDPLGKRDLPDAKNTRSYIMASTQHGSAAFNPVSGPAFGDCEQQTNPNPQAETMRALWVAFTDWVKDGKEPPPSTKPRIDDGTFVPPEKVSFPAMPANSYA